MHNLFSCLINAEPIFFWNDIVFFGMHNLIRLQFQESKKRYPSLSFPPLVMYSCTLELIFTSNHSPRSYNGYYLHVIYVIVD
jgi:hypothetical protein